MSSFCELCNDKHPKEIWRNKHFYAIDASSEDLPGFVRVIAVDHIKEISDLPTAVRSELFEILNTVERIMIDTMHPDKVNWASLGNMVPHVHWHLIARFADDAFFPGSVWSQRLRTTPETVTQKRQADAAVMLRKVASALSEKF